MATAVEAQDRVDTAHFKRYDRLFSLFDPDSVEAFHQVSEQMKQEAREKGDMNRYYDMVINEISYDASRGEFTAALKSATDIMSDIQNDKNIGAEYYGHVYKSLGSIFEHRGNYQMASHYFERALRHLEGVDRQKMSVEHRNLIANLYSGLARVNIYYSLDQAWTWNEQLGRQFGSDLHFLKPYLAHKARIYYYQAKRDSFLIVRQQFIDLLNGPKAPNYKYGERKIEIMYNTVCGRSELALRQLDTLVAENRMNLNAVMRIHDAMGRKDLALDDAYQWVHFQDSINNELLTYNLNELSVALATDRVQRESAREREKLMFAIIVLFALSILLLVMRHVTRTKHLRQMEDKNKELERALEEAKEADRMKATFIQHVSHEMRTPLNIITGNAQIIASPGFQLDDDDREQLLHGINEHTVAITNIVNDLLEMSFSSTKGRYTLDDVIPVNELGRSCLAQKSEKNKGRLLLQFETRLPDDFTIKSNYGALERIIIHLLGNALKFTERGSVTLKARATADLKAVEYIITDTGIGIPPEKQEQIFEHFYKVDQFKQGMGIGLSMSRKVATGLGGTLAVDPTYTDGARFILTIPVE